MRSRLRRLDETANITVYEKGPFNSYANCGLPFLISGVIPKVVYSEPDKDLGEEAAGLESETVQRLL